MTMVFQAGGASVVMPNPDLGNSESNNISVALKKSMNGTRYTYVKSSDKRRFSYTWSSLGRGKIIEVQEFVKFFMGEKIQFIDFRDDSRVVIFDEETISISMLARSAGTRLEVGELTLSFLEVEP